MTSNSRITKAVAMANAVSNVCDMYIKEETRHFCESLTREERVNKELFVKSFKEHILYSLLILSFDGDEDEVTAYMDDLYVEEEEVDCDCDEGVCDDMIVMGIICRKCERVLPPHTMSEHLDVTNKILECPHVRVCDKCHLIECCCEADRLQVIADDKKATDEGYTEIDGRWIKPLPSDDEEEVVAQVKLGDIFRVGYKYMYDRYYYYKVVKVCKKTIKAVCLKDKWRKIDDVEFHYGEYECSYVDEQANEILRQFKKTDITNKMMNSSPHRYRIDAD